MKIVLIPGLGYDSRIFDNLNLSNFKVQYLNWIEPKTNEKIHDYSKRLYSDVDNSSEDIILIGHSLGGIVSQEIASVNQIKKIILISSIKSRKELPLSFKLVRPLMLDKFFTKQITIKTLRFWGKGHGFDNETDKNLFRSMVGKQTNVYLQWALRELSSWHEPKIKSETKIVHIHGTNDKTLPYKLVNNPDFTVDNGSHICVLKKSEEVSEMIKTILQQYL